MSIQDRAPGASERCAHAREQFGDLMDGLPAPEAAAHVLSCLECEHELEALQATRTLLRAAAVPDGAESLDRVLRRFRLAAAQPAAAQQPHWARTLSLAALAAAVALWLLLAGGPAGLHRSPAPPAQTQAALPTNSELDQMAAQHAAQSVGSLDTSAQVQQDALGDANARIETASDEGNGR